MRSKPGLLYLRLLLASIPLDPPRRDGTRRIGNYGRRFVLQAALRVPPRPPESRPDRSTEQHDGPAWIIPAAIEELEFGVGPGGSPYCTPGFSVAQRPNRIDRDDRAGIRCLHADVVASPVVRLPLARGF